MARNKLTATQVRVASKRGVLGDGDGLYLRVGNRGAKSWIFVWRRRGTRREIGLGGASIVSLVAACGMAKTRPDGRATSITFWLLGRSSRAVTMRRCPTATCQHS